ncbi:uncharacterized protein LOC143075919 [Mytilus galloprovincialis]|uniref:uncharacterized protein LOC143075919 n=1 Tax=Mytilus galloprovincialis TaxID=29158 RepID=UPI003F7B75D8
MDLSTTFILCLFCCCTIVQTTSNITTVLPPTAKSTTAQPPKTQSTTAPSPITQSTTAKKPITKSTTAQPPITQSTTALPPMAQSTTAQPPITQSTTAQPPIKQSTPALPLITVSTTALPPITQSTTPQQPITQSTTAQPPITQSTTVQPPITQSTTAQPPITQSTTAQPRITQSTTVQLPITQSTTAVHPTTAKSTALPPSTSKSLKAPATRTLSLEFKCAANGVITDISGVDKGEVVLLNGSNYCHLNEPHCDWKNKTKLNVLRVKGENSSNIAGGKNAQFYHLECKSAGAFVASANTSMQIKVPAPTDFNQEIKKPTEPTKTIRLVINDKKGSPATSVHIGDPLLLKITGPAGYTIEPISCAASSSLDKDYVLWTNKSCSSKDTAVIEDDWKHNTTIPNMVSISMYGFRFVKSNTVVVTCSALFCPIGLQCSANPCVNGKPTVSSRRRRNADQKSKNVYLQESVSTSFTVVDYRIDTSGCSGSFVSVFTYVTACALLLALK